MFVGVIYCNVINKCRVDCVVCSLCCVINKGRAGCVMRYWALLMSFGNHELKRGFVLKKLSTG